MMYLHSVGSPAEKVFHARTADLEMTSFCVSLLNYVMMPRVVSVGHHMLDCVSKE